MIQNSSSSNLILKTDKLVEGISSWSWSDIMNALKQCQDSLPVANSSGIFNKVLDSLVLRITTGSDTSPSSSSSESSVLWSSFDRKNIFSEKLCISKGWWFDDLLTLNAEIILKVVKSLIFHKLDHAIISRFLLYYLRSRIAASVVDKKKVTELIINLLYRLDRNSISCRGLFRVLGVSSSLNISKSSQNRLESMIGSLIDQATLDNLLIPSSTKMSCLYDVNIILRFLKLFVCNEFQVSISKLKRVASLMDLYLAEVAPDPSLKPSKFIALITALPDTARDTHDAIYRAIDMYLEVHIRLSEEENMRICSTLNYKKLSSDSFQHLARNLKFPSKTVIQALETDRIDKLFTALSKRMQCKDSKLDSSDDQIILCTKKLNLSTENEKLSSHLQGMQNRVIELEKICRTMQAQISKVMKPRISNTPCRPRTLPRLCS